LATKIRLKRMGRKKSPFYRIVAIDSMKRRNGREIERLGWFNPISSNHDHSIKEDLVLKWLKDGAILSDAVKSLFKRTGLSYKWHLLSQGKSESEIKKLLEQWKTDEEERLKRKKDKKLAKKASKKETEVETPAEEAPAEETPAEEAPAEEAPAEEAPAEEAPTEEAPAEEAPAEDSNKDDKSK